MAPYLSRSEDESLVISLFEKMDSYKATMGLETFNIELDNKPPMYMPGKHVAGHVNLVTKAPLHFQLILIHCQGEAVTFRTKTKLKDNAPTSVNYKGHDVIFSDETTLLTGPQTAASADDPQPMELNPGTYKLPFYFTLPPSCPGSFEGTFGSIRYFLKASINNSTGNIIHLVKTPFTVINASDLNDNKENSRRWSTSAVVAQPKNSHVTCKANAKKRAYAPGEMVSLKFEINNNSSKVINALNCQLQQTVTYFGWKDNRDSVRNWEENRIVTQITKKTKFPAHKVTPLTWDLFKMPPVSPTLTADDSRLINVQYGLMIATTDIEPTMTLYLPITIGTIPLESAFDSLKNNRTQCFSSVPSEHVPTPPLSLVPLTENHQNLPVPHYLPNVFGSLDIRDQHDGVLLGTPLPFTPLSVSYDWTPVAEELAAKIASEAALREAENKKSKRTVKKSGRKQQAYVVNGQMETSTLSLQQSPSSQAPSTTNVSSTEKRKSLFSSRKKSAKNQANSIASLDKATQTDYEDTDYDTDAHSADEL